MEGSPHAPYPPEFRSRAVALVRMGRRARQTAEDSGIHAVSLQSWLRQDDVDQDRRPGLSTRESAELRAARSAFANLRKRSRASFAPPPGTTTREELPQKFAPGDRPTRRRRGTRSDLLPSARSLPPGLLSIPQAPGQRH